MAEPDPSTAKDPSDQPISLISQCERDRTTNSDAIKGIFRLLKNPPGYAAIGRLDGILLLPVKAPI